MWQDRPKYISRFDNQRSQSGARSTFRFFSSRTPFPFTIKQQQYTDGIRSYVVCYRGQTLREPAINTQHVRRPVLLCVFFLDTRYHIIRVRSFVLLLLPPVLRLFLALHIVELDLSILYTSISASAARKTPSCGGRGCVRHTLTRSMVMLVLLHTHTMIYLGPNVDVDSIMMWYRERRREDRPDSSAKSEIRNVFPAFFTCK